MSYPTAVDTPETLLVAELGQTIQPSHHNILSDTIIELEKKLGFGPSEASSATNGYVLTKQPDGSSIWAPITGVQTFNGRSGIVTLVSADLNGLNGAGLSGIGTGTGGVINTGTTTIGADSDSDGIGVIAFQTRGITRQQVNNDGTVTFSYKVGFGNAAPSAWLDVLPVANDKIVKVSVSGNFIPFEFWDTQDPAAGPFALHIASGVNPGPTSRRDTYMQFGYNPAGLNSDFRFYEAIENFWNPGGTQTQLEWYWEYINPNNGGGSVSMRPFGMVIRHDAKIINANMYVSDFSIFHWPDHAEDGSGFVAAIYPDFRINRGNLMIDPYLDAESADIQGIQISQRWALRYSKSSKQYMVGNASFADDTIWFPNIHAVGMNADGPNPSVAQLWLQSGAIGREGLRISAIGGQTAKLFAIWGTVDGGFVYGVKADGEHVIGAGNTGGGDVGFKRVGTWPDPHFQFTDAGAGINSGYAKVDIGTLFLYDGSIKQVTYGAADSGGSGKKFLVIDN